MRIQQKKKHKRLYKRLFIFPSEKLLDDEFQLRNGQLTKFVTPNIYLYSLFCWVNYFQKKIMMIS